MTAPTPVRRAVGWWISLVLLALAVILFVLIGLEVIDPATTNPTVGEWEAFALAMFAGSFIAREF